MSKFQVRALRAALVVPLLMGRALVASAGHASASINPDNVDRPKISAGDRDFGNRTSSTSSAAALSTGMRPTRAREACALSLNPPADMACFC